MDILLKDGNPYVLEVNTLPGMTETSLLPKSALAAGFTFSNLLDEIIAGSLKEQRANQAVQVTQELTEMQREEERQEVAGHA